MHGTDGMRDHDSRGEKQLEAIVSDRNRQRKHAERPFVVLASIGDAPMQAIANESGSSPGQC